MLSGQFIKMKKAFQLQNVQTERDDIAVILGDFNFAIGDPNHQKTGPLAMATNIVQAALHRLKIQGGKFIDGVFCKVKGKAAINQPEMQHINPNTGDAYIPKERKPVALMLLQIEQRQDYLQFRQVISLDDRYSTGSLIKLSESQEEKTAAEYETQLRQTVVTRGLSTEEVSVRPAINLRNEQGIKVQIPKQVYDYLLNTQPNPLLQFDKDDTVLKIFRKGVDKEYKNNYQFTVIPSTEDADKKYFVSVSLEHVKVLADVFAKLPQNLSLPSYLTDLSRDLSSEESSKLKKEREQYLQTVQQQFDNLKNDNNLAELARFALNLREIAADSDFINRHRERHVTTTTHKELLRIADNVEKHCQKFEVQLEKLNKALQTQLRNDNIAGNKKSITTEIQQAYNNLNIMLQQHEQTPMTKEVLFGKLLNFLDAFQHEKYDSSVTKQVRNLIEILAPNPNITFHIGTGTLSFRTDVTDIRDWFEKKNIQFSGKQCFTPKLVDDGMTPVGFWGTRAQRLEISFVKDDSIDITTAYTNLLSAMVKMDFIAATHKKAILDDVKRFEQGLGNQLVLV